MLKVVVSSSEETLIAVVRVIEGKANRWLVKEKKKERRKDSIFDLENASRYTRHDSDHPRTEEVKVLVVDQNQMLLDGSNTNMVCVLLANNA